MGLTGHFRSVISSSPVGPARQSMGEERVVPREIAGPVRARLDGGVTVDAAVGTGVVRADVHVSSPHSRSRDAGLVGLRLDTAAEQPPDLGGSMQEAVKYAVLAQIDCSAQVKRGSR